MHNFVVGKSLFSKVIVLLGVFAVGRTANRKHCHVFRVELDVDVEVGGEEGIIEVLEQVLLEVFVLHCTHVVEPLYLGQLLASFRSELFRYPYNSHMDSR